MIDHPIPSTWRGHRIRKVKGFWVYEDGVRVSKEPRRDCGVCGRSDTPEGYDACLGAIEGVRNACCGHGNPQTAYAVFEDGTEVRGEAAIQYFESLGRIA